MRVLFLEKAQARGAAAMMGDLFAEMVPVEGYTTARGRVVAPTYAVRHKKREAPTREEIEDLFEQRPEPVNTPDQPYLSENIQLSRGSLTQKPAGNQLPEEIAASLRPHAQDAVNLALEKLQEGYRSFLISDGTGAGKTRQALAVSELWRRANPDKPVLIITQNARVVSDAFGADSQAMGLHIHAVDSLSEVKGGGIYVTTYNRVGRGDFAGGEFSMVVCDEAHNLKNKTSKKTAGTLKLIKGAGRSLLLTATPGDKPEHIGYLASCFGFNFMRAMRAFGYRRSTYGLELEITKAEALTRVGAFFDALTKRGLMVKREVSMGNIDVATDQIKIDQGDLRVMLEADAALEREAADAPPMRRGLVKMLGLNALRTALEPFKLDATVERVQDRIDVGRKVVVFANRINPSEMPDWWPDADSMTSVGTLDTLGDKLEAAGMRVGRLYGKHLKRAQETIRGFQKGDTQVIIATPQAGGTGINLDDTVGDAPRSMVVMTAPFSSLEAIQQIGRINRLTTKSPADVRFVHASGVPVDDWNQGIILQKLALLGATVKGDVSRLDISRMAEASDEDLAELAEKIKDLPEPQEIDLATFGLKDPSIPEPTAVDRSKLTYLNVPFAEKDYAKARGARWDPAKRKWYVRGDPHEALTKYIQPDLVDPETGMSKEDEKVASGALKQVYLKVPFAEKDYAKGFGARWDPEKKSWYVLGEVPAELEKYLKDYRVRKAGDKARAQKAREKLTPEQIDAVQEALMIVAGQCDGAQRRDDCGFNGTDARTGRALAMAGDLTEEEAWGARNLVYKYKGQFGSALAEKMGKPQMLKSARVLFVS